MSDIAINQVLQMRAMQAMANPQATGGDPEPGRLLYTDGIDSRCKRRDAGIAAMTTRFEMGDPSVSLAEVMVNSQKAVSTGSG